MSAGGQAVGVRDVLALARDLVRAPSPNRPGDERAAAEVVQGALEEAGLPRARVVARAPERPNLLLTLDLGPGGRHLVLSGHLDTKPVGDADWTFDPFGADVDGDRLLGLGSADMKAAIAAMVTAAARVVGRPGGAGRLSLLFTADEEDGAAFGAHHVAGTVPLGADGVVIGEPGGIERDFDALHLVSRGIARLRLVAEAPQGHSSLSGRPGVRNAGVDAARLVVAVADELHLAVPPDPGLAGWEATVNPGLAWRGGVGPGVLPGVLRVDTDVRVLPGMGQEEVVGAFADLAASVAARTGAALGVERDAPPIGWLPPAQVAAADPLAVAARDACAATFGAAPRDAVFPGTTDATWFAALQQLPTLPALGPGLLRRAHAADEWVSITAVHQAVDLYEALAVTYCGGAA